MNSNRFDVEELVLALYDAGAVQIGEFKLHSGRTSMIYLDLRLLASYPRLLRQATAAYRTVLDKLEFDLLAATPLAGLPIGTAICLDMDVPLIYPRKSVKGYGTGKAIEGKWRAGQTAVVVDDLVTSGDSIMQAIVPLEEADLQVNDAVVLIDREQGGEKILLDQGYHLHAIIKISDLLKILEDRGRITSDQQEKVLKSLT